MSHLPKPGQSVFLEGKSVFVKLSGPLLDENESGIVYVAVKNKSTGDTSSPREALVRFGEVVDILYRGEHYTLDRLLKRKIKSNPGGSRSAQDYLKSQLRIGTKIEMEHTKKLPRCVRKGVAQQIAMDHLAEFPDYYERLVKMEREAKRYWKKGQ